jgi:hypothetical protein
VDIVLPPWLLAAAALCLGWNIGQRFDRAVIRHALRLLPRLFAVLSLLILLCTGMALLVVWMDIDPLTAYLAMSWRGRLGGPDRRLQPCGRALRHGHADRPPAGGAGRGAGGGALGGAPQRARPHRLTPARAGTSGDRAPAQGDNARSWPARGATLAAQVDPMATLSGFKPAPAAATPSPS